MATTYIVVDQTKRLGATLRNAVEVLRNAKNVLSQCKAIMDTQVNVSDYSMVEVQFGIPTGQGQTAYNLVAGVVADLGGANENSLLNQLG